MRLGRGSVGGGAVVRLGRGHGTQESLFQPISCHSKFHDTYGPICVMFFSVKETFCSGEPFWQLDPFLRGHATLHFAVSVSPSVGPSVGMSVHRSVHNIFELQEIFALLLLPNRPWLDCRVSGLFSMYLLTCTHTHISRWCSAEIFLACYATLLPAMSVRRSSGRLVGFSPFHFFGVFELLWVHVKVIILKCYHEFSYNLS